MSAILKMTAEKAISAISSAAEIERKYYAELNKAVEYLRTPNKTLVIAVRSLEKLRSIAIKQGLTMAEALANGMFDSVLKTYVAYNKQLDYESLKLVHETETLKLQNKISVLGKSMSAIEKYHGERFENEIKPLQAFEVLLIEAGGKTLATKMSKMGYEKGKQGTLKISMDELRKEIEVNYHHTRFLSYSKSMQNALEKETPDMKKHNEYKIKAIAEAIVLVKLGKGNLLPEAVVKSIEPAKAETVSVSAN